MADIYEEALQKYFGYTNFRDKQFEIIDAVINSCRDVCAIMFTGAGKSLCYQFPAVFTGKVSIVVSPLISLMDDQVMKMQSLGISAVCLNSTVADKRVVKEAILQGQHRVVYMTPEYLITQEKYISNLAVLEMLVGIFIDESHCISTWGNDFREAYKKLDQLRHWLPDTPIVALTATATLKVQTDIIRGLSLHHPLLVKTTFDRPNLRIIIQKKSVNVISDILPIVNTGEPTIVYCQTRKLTNDIASKLQAEGILCEGYHAGLTTEERRRIHEEFFSGVSTCIVATMAFGMGIDITIRNVIHYGMPKDIESYYQEIGRAGRDGLPSNCYTFYNLTDNSTNDFFINQIDNIVYRHHRLEMAGIMKKYIYSGECRRKFILNYFGEAYTSANCQNCDNCLHADERINENYGKECFHLLDIIQDLDGSYGTTMIINIIRGSKGKALTARMRNLRGYNQGKDHTLEWWKIFVRVIANHGFIKEHSIAGGHGFTIKITKEGRQWFTENKSKDDNQKQLFVHIPT